MKVLLALWLTALLCACVSGAGYQAGDPFSSSFFHNSVSYHNTASSSHHSSSHNADPCPAFTDFSAGYFFSSDDIGYPDAAVTAELNSRPDLAVCLGREVLPQPADTVPLDPALTHSLDSCPATRYPLKKFVGYNATCWMMKDVQELFDFTICRTRHCVTCDSGFLFGGKQNRCVPQYQYISVWAFCEGRTPGDQISRERIIVPQSCSCLSLQCQTDPWNWKRK